LENGKETFHAEGLKDNNEVGFNKLYQNGFWLFMFGYSHSDELCNKLYFPYNCREYPDQLSNHWHHGNYCIIDVYSFMVTGVLFFSGVHFFQLHTSLKLVPEIVQCCQLQSEGIWWLASDAVFSVTSLKSLGHSLCQWLPLFLCMTLTVNSQNKTFF